MIPDVKKKTAGAFIPKKGPEAPPWNAPSRVI
jgi:hypothetical protein